MRAKLHLLTVYIIRNSPLPEKKGISMWVEWGCCATIKGLSGRVVTFFRVKFFYSSLPGSLQDVLQYTTVKILNDTNCDEFYGESPMWFLSGMMCAASPGRDSCQVFINLIN